MRPGAGYALAAVPQNPMDLGQHDLDEANEAVVKGVRCIQASNRPQREEALDQITSILLAASCKVQPAGCASMRP